VKKEKESRSYYLENVVMKWLDEQAAKEQRSASSWLNRLILSMMNKKNNEKS
jgi:hypothetical protein